MIDIMIGVRAGIPKRISRLCEAEQTPGVASHMPAKDACGSTRACAVPAHMTETVAAGAWAIHP